MSAAEPSLDAKPPVRDFTAFADAAGPLPRICVVTGELVGPFKNGGLGTSMTGLAEFLAAHGAELTVLYTGEVIGDLEEWRAKYAASGVALRALAEFERPALVGPLADIGWTNAWLVYAALKTLSFDVVHFNDTVGEGVYCFLAKRMGLAFADTLLCLALHSPTEWILEGNGHPVNWPGFCCFTSAERLSIRSTDLLWGPSRYLIDWLTHRRYDLPEQVFNQQYVIPTDDLFGAGLAKLERAATASEPIPPRRPKEIVFFGRLEERKGIRLFVNAITKLGPELARRGISVTFMGKPSSVNGVPADEFLATRSGQWPFQWRIESGFDQRQAVAHLRQADCVAVMASPVDNSPCTVYEALQFGFPFIAARTGGIPELVHPDDHALHLFDYRVEALSSLLLKVLDVGIGNARLAVPVAMNQARWLGMHRSWRQFLPAPALVSRHAWAVVVDATGNSSAEDVQATLASALACLDGDSRRTVILRHGVASPSAERLAGIEVIDELDDVTGEELVASLAAAGANAVLMVRAGITVARDAGPVLDRALGAGSEAVVPMTHVVPVGATMLMLPGSAALTMLEGEYDSGAIALSLPRTLERLGPRVQRLDRNRPYLGIVDELYGAGGEVWPLPEVLLTAADGSAVVVRGLFESRRNRSFATVDVAELYQVMSIGRHYYRALSGVKVPAPPSAVVAQAPAAVEHLPPETTSKLGKIARKVILTAYPAKGQAVYEQLKRTFGRL